MKRMVALSILAVAVVGFGVAVAVEMRRDGSSEPAPEGNKGVAPAYGLTIPLDLSATHGLTADVGPAAAGEAAAPLLADGDEGQRAAPPAATGTGEATEGALSAQFLDRKIAMTGSMTLQVKDVGGAFEDVGRIATAAGGFVGSSTFGYQGDDQIASVTIRVPASRFQDVLAQVRSLAEKVDAEQAAAQDLTERYTDLQSQMRNLQRTEERYLELLGRAQTINEILQLEDRLQSVRGQIEQIQGRINVIEHTTDMATLTVHLRPPAVPQQEHARASAGPDPLGAARDAWDASLVVLGNVASGLLMVLVFSWWLVPVLAVCTVVGARLVRARRSQAAA